MANFARGEASFSGPSGEVYHIVMDFNAYAEAEDAADMDVNTLLKAVSPEIDPTTGAVIKSPRIKHLGALLFGGLQDRHPGISRKEANRLLSCEGAGEALAKAMRGSMPQADASAEGKVISPVGTGTKPKKTGQRRG